MNNNINQVFYSLQTKLSSEFVIQNNQLQLQGSFEQPELSDLVQQLLSAEGNTDNQYSFDFLLGGYLLRSSLQEHIEQYGLQTEETLTLEYTFAQQEPKLKSTTQLNDWIIAIMHINRYIVLGLSNGSIVLCNEKGKKLKTFETSLAKTFTNHDNIIISTHWDLSVQIHKLVDQEIELISSVKLPQAGESVAFNGHTICVGCSDGTLVIAQIDDLEKQTSFKVHSYQVSCIKFVSSNVILTGSFDHSILFFNIKKGSVVKQLFAKDSVITDILYNNDQIISAHEDGYLKLWKQDQELPERVYKSSFSMLTAIAINEQQQLVAASMDGKVSIWDLRSDSPTFTLQGEGKILAVAWIKDLLIFGGSANKLYIYSKK